jgi:hypothetical protein
MPTSDEWGTTIPAVGDNPNIPSDLETFRGTFRGYFPQYFATKAERNTATTAFLARPGNAAKTGMQAYVGELRCNTIYLPTVGWRFLSPIVHQDLIQRGYGTGLTATGGSSAIDPAGTLNFGNLLVGTKLKVVTQLLFYIEGPQADQTITVTWDVTGATRDTIDPLSTPVRWLNHPSQPVTFCFDQYTDISQFNVTSSTVAINLRLWAGIGPRPVIRWAIHDITVYHPWGNAA